MEIAYLAGFFDGEGNVSLMKKDNGFVLRIAITNCNRQVLEQVKHKFGGRIQSKNNPIGRPIHQWTLGATRAVELLSMMMQHLVVKKEQAILAIEWQKYRLGPGFWVGEEADYCRAQILRLRNEIMILNSSSGNKRKNAKVYAVHPATISTKALLDRRAGELK